MTFEQAELPATSTSTTVRRAACMRTDVRGAATRAPTAWPVALHPFTVVLHPLPLVLHAIAPVFPVLAMMLHPFTGALMAAGFKTLAGVLHPLALAL